jgi:hypothetical protein
MMLQYIYGPLCVEYYGRAYVCACFLNESKNCECVRLAGEPVPKNLSLLYEAFFDLVFSLLGSVFVVSHSPRLPVSPPPPHRSPSLPL